MSARHRDGSAVWVELTAARLQDAHGPLIVLDMRDARPRRTVRERLRRSEASLRAVLEGLPDATVAAARDGRIALVNDLAEELFGYRREELIGRPVELLWPERLRARYTRNMELYFSVEHPMRFSARAYGLRSDGSEFVGEMTWGIVTTDEGPLLLAVGRDISARLEAERELRRRSAQQAAVAGLSELALAGADGAEICRAAVRAAGEALSAERLEIRHDGQALAGWGAVVARTEPVTLEIASAAESFGTLTVFPAAPLRDEDRTFLRAVVNVLATAIDRLKRDERMRHQALHDSLTGLANRVLCRDRLAHALARARRSGSRAGLLFLDLDNFKAVNDGHGHAHGDALLVALADRLRGAVRPTDTVGRLGGDEFVVICEDADGPTMQALSRRLSEAVRDPLVVGGVPHALTTSIGIAFGSGAADPDALLAAADAAAYRAKGRGPGRVEPAGAAG